MAMFSKKSNFIRKICSLLITPIIIFNFIIPPSYAQTIAQLPSLTTAIQPGIAFNPAVIRGMTIYPDNPLKFDFIVDQGDARLSDKEFKKEATKLIKYFMASLTVPEDQTWVNLSPYEKDRIIPQNFGSTEMGQDMLAQDYLLKQLTASMMHPESDFGKTFWARVYKKTQEKFGTTDIPVNTFNKIWIMPEKAFVYEHNKGAFIVESHLKVMLEEDYLALEHNKNNPNNAIGVDSEELKKMDAMSTQIIREILVPEIEKEVNEGKTFANLRQIYNSMILATWYKEALKQSILSQVYADKNKIKGIESQGQDVKEKIYNQYLEAFEKGAYNFIKEEYDPQTQEVIPRKYFSGGITGKRLKGALAKGKASQAMMVSNPLEAKKVFAAASALKDGIAVTVQVEGSGYQESGETRNAAMLSLTNGRTILRSIGPNIERGYDVRGVAIGPKATMTPDVFYTAGIGVGMELMTLKHIQGRRPRVIIMGDQRSTTPALRNAISEGFASRGVDVDFSNEMISTPGANVIVRQPESDYDASIMITASHNPWTKHIENERNPDGSYKEHEPENGFKVSIRGADGQHRGVYGKRMADILARAFSVEAEKPSDDPGKITEVKVLDRYLDHLAKSVEAQLSKFGFTLQDAQEGLVLVVDTGNAVTGPIAKAVIQDRLGISYVGIDDQVITDINGRPAHESDPSKRPLYAEHLTAEVQAVASRPENKGKIVMGLAFDGDGDRIGMTDEGGNEYLSPNKQGFFFFHSMKQIDPRLAVVMDIRAGQEIRDLLQQDADAELWHAPGWPIVREAIQAADADIAVEASHHTMMRQFEDRRIDAIDDGLFAGLFAGVQALKLRREGSSIRQLLDRRWYPALVEELRPKVTEAKAGDRYELMPQIAQALSGRIKAAYQGAQIRDIPSPGERGAVRLQISDNTGNFIGWILMRASNTQAKLSIQAQGKDEDTIVSLAKTLRTVLAEFPSVDPGEVNKILSKTIGNRAQLAEQYAYDDEMGISHQQDAVTGEWTKGGIDFNPKALDLNIKRDGKGIPLPVSQQPIEQFMRLDGFLPVIINVAPIQNLPLILGLDTKLFNKLTRL